MVMAENVRTGFVWDTFMKNPEARRGMERAGFMPYQHRPLPRRRVQRLRRVCNWGQSNSYTAIAPQSGRDRRAEESAFSLPFSIFSTSGGGKLGRASAVSRSAPRVGIGGLPMAS